MITVKNKMVLVNRK